jgi:nucleotide-binding universal stress UspA family protein
MTLQHMLVPLDFSEPASRALEYAIRLARQLQARLTLLHVIYLPPLAGADLTTQMAEIEAAARHAMDERLRRVQEAGIAVQSIIVHGIPWQEIVDKAKDTQADLIVMSTHGRTGLQHMLLGSVAEKVVRFSPCSVLVTRQAA